jgi:hypothetical protein
MRSTRRARARRAACYARVGRFREPARASPGGAYAPAVRRPTFSPGRGRASRASASSSTSGCASRRRACERIELATISPRRDPHRAPRRRDAAGGSRQRAAGRVDGGFAVGTKPARPVLLWCRLVLLWCRLVLLGAALVLPWCCPGTALVLPWCSPGALPVRAARSLADASAARGAAGGVELANVPDRRRPRRPRRPSAPEVAGVMLLRFAWSPARARATTTKTPRTLETLATLATLAALAVMMRRLPVAHGRGSRPRGAGRAPTPLRSWSPARRWPSELAAGCDRRSRRTAPPP